MPIGTYLISNIGCIEPSRLDAEGEEGEEEEEERGWMRRVVVWLR